MAWISAHFTTATATSPARSPYYMLYGIERIGALADRQTIGRLDWFEKGRSFIRSTQKARRLVGRPPRRRDEHRAGRSCS